MYDADNAMAKAGEIDKSLNSLQDKADKLGVLTKAEFDRQAGTTSDVDQFMKDVDAQNDLDDFLKTVPVKPNSTPTDDVLTSMAKKPFTPTKNPRTN